MVGKAEQAIELKVFELKEALAELWKSYHVYRRERSKERGRLDELLPDEDEEAQAKRDDPFGERKRFYIEIDGQMVACGRTWIQYATSPGFESNKHLLWFDAGVLSPFRRQGIGTAFLRKALSLMNEHDKSVLTLHTEEDDGHEFLRAVGAEAKSNTVENRLDLDSVDWEMVARWVKEGRERNPDTELVFYENRIPEDELPEITPVLTELSNTVPFDDLDHGDIVMTTEMYKEWYERADQLKSEHHMYLTKEPDGSISGMTDVEWMPQTADAIWQNFTGVHPDHRGRGLGKWLKAAMLEFVRARYPEAKYVSTGNANSNEPMLGINHKLGFKKHRENTTYQISREGLAQYLESVP